MNSKLFQRTVHLKKRRNWNLQTSLITISQIASYNLRNLSLEVSKLVQIYHFWVESFGYPEESSYKQFTWQKGSKCGGTLKILLITVSRMASCNLRNLFLEVWKLAQMYHFWVGSFGYPEESSYKQFTWQKRSKCGRI